MFQQRPWKEPRSSAKGTLNKTKLNDDDLLYLGWRGREQRAELLFPVCWFRDARPQQGQTACAEIKTIITTGLAISILLSGIAPSAGACAVDPTATNKGSFVLKVVFLGLMNELVSMFAGVMTSLKT